VPIREIDVEELRDARARGERVELLDVRTEGEHELVRLDPCRLVPLHEIRDRIDELDDWKAARVVVYCHHGIRSRSGAAILMDAGFTDVASLRGGIDAWSMRVDPGVPRY
jgi:adenylyltransferase/sulfurtransferase